VRKGILLGMVVAGIILLIAGLLLLRSQSSGSNAGQAEIGQVSLVSGGSSAVLDKGSLTPDFEIKYADGKIVRLSDFKGRPVMVNFWATWCKFCEREMPAIQQAYEKYKDDGFMVIGVDSKEPASKVAGFVADYKLTFMMGIDPTDAVFRRYRGGGWPHSVFVDREGIVRGMYAGQLSASQLEQFIGEIR